MKSLIPYAQLVRLPNVFTAMADIVLGYLVMLSLGARFGAFLCLLIASTLLYWAGMIWNDYFDLHEDRRDRPGRPLPSGRVAVSTAVWLGLGFFAGGVLFAFLADLQAAELHYVSTSIAVCLVVAILLYDGALKGTLVGPLVMGSCRFLNILLGLSVIGEFPPVWGLLMAAVVGLYVSGVTLFSRMEAKTSNPADLRVAAAVIAGSLVLALAVPSLAQARGADVTATPLFPYLLVVFAFVLGLAVVPAIRSPVPIRVQAAVKRALLGLVVLDALLASSLVGIFGLLLALLVLPGIYLGRWLYST
jgi:4-hydroxybenzoate polyprenyltransferase